MGEEPSVKILSCPRCGAQQREPYERCHACGSSLDLSGVGERATLPSHSVLRDAEAGTASRAAPDGGEREAANGPEATPNRDMSMAKGEWKLIDDQDAVGATAPDPLIGLVIAGRYRIVECVGRGGMGVVYKVEHTEIGKLLALKLLAGELSRQKEVVRRFKREALLASRLTHPNSVQVFDFGVWDGLTYLVMELVVGQDLSSVIKAEPVQSAQLAKIIVQVCNSLAEAHGIGIVHRDMKPENIVVAKARDGSDFAKVLDFGLAKLRESPDLNVVTGTGQIVGTPFYMAPEQIHGNPVDGRADIYGLGAVMYEALTGETVFRASSPLAVFTKHLTEDPVPPSHRAPHRLIPPAMDIIILRCLEKSPDKRFQRVEDLQLALVEHLGGQSGVEALLNSARMQALQADLLSCDSSRTQGLSRTLGLGEVATRDEVTAFKRKLARQRWLSAAVAFIVLAGVAYGGAQAYERATAKPPFAGLEEEPNNQATEATLVPFGRPVRGMLGKRIDSERSDRDFYRTEIPPSASVVSLGSTALPNMATCLWIYGDGEVEPRGRYCTGGPAKNLFVPHMRLEPGAYLFVVMQDRTPYDGAEAPFVQENVSDSYELKVTKATQDTSVEVEPNDDVAVAVPVAAGASVTGKFGWVGDVDVVCAWPKDSGTPGRVRFSIVDAEHRPRDFGAVLEMTYVVDGRKQPPLRVHRARAGSDAGAGVEGDDGSEPAGTDVLSPWVSEPFEVSAAQHCVRLRLTGDPGAGNDAPMTPPVSPENWKVSVENVD